MPELFSEQFVHQKKVSMLATFSKFAQLSKYSKFPTFSKSSTFSEFSKFSKVSKFPKCSTFQNLQSFQSLQSLQNFRNIRSFQNFQSLQSSRTQRLDTNGRELFVLSQLQELRLKLEVEATRLQHRLKLLNADPRASHDFAKRYGWQDEWDTNPAKGVISMTPRSICGSV